MHVFYVFIFYSAVLISLFFSSMFYRPKRSKKKQWKLDWLMRRSRLTIITFQGLFFSFCRLKWRICILASQNVWIKTITNMFYRALLSNLFNFENSHGKSLSFLASFAWCIVYFDRGTIKATPLSNSLLAIRLFCFHFFEFSFSQFPPEW